MKKNAFLLVISLIISLFASTSTFADTDSAAIGKQNFKEYAQYSKELDTQAGIPLSWESEESNPYYLLGINEPAKDNDDFTCYLGFQSASYGDDVLQGTFKFTTATSGIFEYEFAYTKGLRNDGTFQIKDGTLIINYINIYNKSDKNSTNTIAFKIDASKLAQNQIKVLLNEKPMTFEQPPINLNGRVMVPLRAIFEAMGATIKWDGSTQTVTATKGDTKVILTIGDPKPLVNNKVVELDQPGVIVGGSTLVPVRFIGEAMGGTVKWDEDTKTVRITK